MKFYIWRKPDTYANVANACLIAFKTGKRKFCVLQKINSGGNFDRTQPLLLSLAHPLEAAQDRTLELRPSVLGWHAEGTIDLGHDWNARLQPKDGSWRIDGRWLRGQQAVFVHPAVSGTD